jgi:hypothetical protein
MNKKQQTAQEAARLSRDNKKLKRAALKTESQTPKLRADIEAPRPHSRLALKWTKRLVGCFLALVATIGGPYVIYDLRPKIHISKAESLKESDPMETQFTISNNSVFGLRDTLSYCEINKLSVSPGRSITSTLVRDPSGDIGPVPSGQSATVSCPLNQTVIFPTGHVDFADVSVTVDFRYSIWWERIVCKSRFTTKTGADGLLRWFPQPSQVFACSN